MAWEDEQVHLLQQTSGQSCWIEGDPGSNPLISTASREVLLDAGGRPSDLLVNGQVFSHIDYNPLGQISVAMLADGSAIIPSYDAGTLAQVGAQRFSADALQTESSVSFTARGLVASEALATAQGTIERTYSYNPDRTLASYSDGGPPQKYSYDVSGLQSAASHGYDAHSDIGNIWWAQASFTYSPNGQIVQANVGSNIITYVYDESGQRIVRERTAPLIEATRPASSTPEPARTPIQVSRPVLPLVGWHRNVAQRNFYFLGNGRTRHGARRAQTSRLCDAAVSVRQRSSCAVQFRRYLLCGTTARRRPWSRTHGCSRLRSSHRSVPTTRSQAARR